MITYRMETQPPEENSSSRLFTYVAVSFVVLAVVVVGVVFVMTRRSLSITIQAKDDTKTVTVPLNVATSNATAVGSYATSTSFSYSQSFHPTGTKTVDGIATGHIIIYNKTNSPQPLVKTTRFLSKEGVLFRLSDKVTVPANGQISAAVYADQPGKQGEISPTQFTIPGLPSDKQTVIYGTSTETFTGGVQTSAILNQKDIDEAKKSYKEKVLAAYQDSNSAELPAGMVKVSMVYKDNLVVDKKVGEKVTEFTVSGSNTIVTVVYSKDETLAALQKELRSKIDVSSEKIISATKEPRVTLSNYNSATGIAELNVVQEVVVTVDPNADKLAPVNFFGKTKDEIERYLLSLDHVERAEVVLSPSWIDSAPKTPDKIKVVVKDM